MSSSWHPELYMSDHPPQPHSELWSPQDWSSHGCLRSSQGCLRSVQEPPQEESSPLRRSTPPLLTQPCSFQRSCAELPTHSGCFQYASPCFSLQSVLFQDQRFIAVRNGERTEQKRECGMRNEQSAEPTAQKLAQANGKRAHNKQ